MEHRVFKSFLKYALILICLLSGSQTGFSQTVYPKADHEKIQTVLHLLEYVAGDYPGAVSNGRVLSESEYAEQTEFVQTALSTARQIFKADDRGDQAVLGNLTQLQKIVAGKGDSKEVAALANETGQQIIKITGFQIAPSTWPDLVKGEKIYALNCASCHGMNGDGNGELAKTLHPSPADFRDRSLMKDMFPFKAYNTIRLGVTGTAMPAFTRLTSSQSWDVAFYIVSLRYKDTPLDSAELSTLFNKASGRINLADVATLPDTDLLLKLKDAGVKAEQALISLRLHSGKESGSDPLDIAESGIKASLALYKKGDYTGASEQALSAYLDGIEPVEGQLRANDAQFTAKLEQQMLSLRTAMSKKKPLTEVEKQADVSLAMISKAAQMIHNRDLTFWLSFLISMSIVLREGLEAFLIIAVILVLIRKTGKKKALLWIHGGWILAVAAGLAGWFLSGQILRIGGQDREMLEGVVTLFAVCVLTFAGLWLHNKTHAKHWKKFVEEKITRYIQTENMAGLGAFSFMVVFREAFEAILFLQAVNLETAVKNRSSIGLGVMVAFAIIVLLLISFLKFSGKIPIRPLFRYSSWMITILAVVLIGDGVHAIQEAGYFSATPFVLDLRLEWLGIYPTTETILSQLILIAVITGLWYISKWRLKVAK